MSSTSYVALFLRPVTSRRILTFIPKSPRSEIHHSSSQPEKLKAPAESPPPPTSSNKIVKKAAPIGFDSLIIQEPVRDPLEPANSKNAVDHVLQPLARPIGLTTIPQPGQNSGIDMRTFSQRRDDFFNYEKHLARRKELTKTIARPYYRDWSRLQFNQGKIFLAPTRLIRADRALYFPNLRGITLADPKNDQDTTTVAKGGITLVRVFTGRWAESQVNTWIEDETLKKMFEAEETVLHRLDLNVEQNRMKSAIVRMFMPGLRKSMPVKMHKNYFLIRRGFEQEYKHALGMFNAQVGHLYLLDDMCRIRWGGSGPAQEDEKTSLRKSIVKLAQELKIRQEQQDWSTSLANKEAVAKFVAKIPSILT